MRVTDHVTDAQNAAVRPGREYTGVVLLALAERRRPPPGLVGQTGLAAKLRMTSVAAPHAKVGPARSEHYKPDKSRSVRARSHEIA